MAFSKALDILDHGPVKDHGVRAESVQRLFEAVQEIQTVDFAPDAAVGGDRHGRTGFDAVEAEIEGPAIPPGYVRDHGDAVPLEVAVKEPVQIGAVDLFRQRQVSVNAVVKPDDSGVVPKGGKILARRLQDGQGPVVMDIKVYP